MGSSTSSNPILDLIEGQIPEHVSSFKGTGQYTQGGASTCGLAALNAVKVVLGHEKSGVKGIKLLERIITRQAVDEIVEICARWASQLHLEVDDIVALPMFKNTLVLQFSEHQTAESSNFTALLRHLERTSLKRAMSAAVVITRPPEIFTVFHVLTHTRRRSKIFAIFDPYPRPSKGVKGASFRLFATLAATSDYVTRLLQIDPCLLSGGLQWEAQLLNHYSGHIFLAGGSHNFHVNDSRSMYDANMDILDLRSILSDMEGRNKELTSENSALMKRVAQLEDASAVRQSHTESSLWEKEIGGSGRPSSPVAGPSNHPQALKLETSSRAPNKAPSNIFRQIFSKSKGDSKAKLTNPFDHKERQEEADWEVAWRAQEEFDREYNALSSETARLRDSAQVLLECPICFQTYHENFVAQIDSCRHKLCSGCMTQFVTTKLEEHRYPIICPICQARQDVKDPGVITRELVDQLGLTEAQYSMWTELELSQFSITLDCPKCRCSTFVDRNDHRDMQLLMCPLRGCNHVWCKDCQRPVNPGTQHSCDGSLELDGLMKSRGWRYCPGCKTPTEKRDGCNHMTCPARGCNTHFCYFCGENIVRSAHQGDVGPAVTTHYRRCKMFRR
ncbi:hypothetical protein JB92DRAFT_3044501 [Gautieria morchelliformis]|nr:hypothetical protein JB92DRAFT_3044501 [Gautieria morchelliformis]